MKERIMNGYIMRNNNYIKYLINKLDFHGYRMGSMSVEAVFVLPLILFTLFFILFFSFYTHQRIWFTEAANEAVLSPETEEEKAMYLLKNAPLAIYPPTVDMQRSKDRVQISYKGTAFSLMGHFNLYYKVQAETALLKPVDHIRKIRLIHRLTDT